MTTELQFEQKAIHYLESIGFVNTSEQNIYVKKIEKFYFYIETEPFQLICSKDVSFTELPKKIILEFTASRRNLKLIENGLSVLPTVLENFNLILIRMNTDIFKFFQTEYENGEEFYHYQMNNTLRISYQNGFSVDGVRLSD